MYIGHFYTDDGDTMRLLLRALSHDKAKCEARTKAHSMHFGWKVESIETIRLRLGTRFFSNGYGVYVAPDIEGKFGAAVLKGNEEVWDMCWDTSVAGGLDEDEVRDVISKVSQLNLVLENKYV